jgi:hypothetical protein
MTDIRAAARAGHQAAMTAVTNVRTMAAAMAHHGRAKGSTRCSEIERSVGTNAKLFACRRAGRLTP